MGDRVIGDRVERPGPMNRPPRLKCLLYFYVRTGTVARVNQQHQAGVPRRGAAAAGRGRYLFLFAACALMINALIGEGGLTTIVRARQERQAVEASLGSLRHGNLALRREADSLRSDPRVIEAVARQEFGMLAPGERAVYVVGATLDRMAVPNQPAVGIPPW